MRLLIMTQAVDLDHPILGFFHRWIEEFSKHCEHIHVICLTEGRHTLPKNVTVHSLGKESGRSRLKYLMRFYRYIWTLRRDYDIVFVHMNPEYAVLGVPLWRVLGKRTGLWYIHPKSSLSLRAAAAFTDVIFSASEKSFPFTTSKLVAVGHGVDTAFFNPGPRQDSPTVRIMHVGRIAPVKHIEVILDAIMELERRGASIIFDHYGGVNARDAAYAAALKKRVTHASGIIFHGETPPEMLREAYQAHDIHVNATESGSFDKAVIESMACGTITLASSRAFDLPPECVFPEGDSHALVDTLERVARLPAAARGGISHDLRERAENRYSLVTLIPRILGNLV